MELSSTPTPSTSGMKKKPRALNGQAREIVYKVHTFFKEEKKLFCLDLNTTDRTAAATGVSRATITRIVREANQSISSGSVQPKFVTPKKSHGGANKKEFDSLVEGMIRRKIHEFFIRRMKSPTTGQLLAEMKADGLVDCQRDHFRKKVHEIGFNWEPCGSNRKLLIENTEITRLREQYILAIWAYRRSGRPIVYLDETHVLAPHTLTKHWQSPEKVEFTKAMSTRNRLIMLHAGGEMGFISNALLIFPSHSTTTNYNNDINSTKFTKWLEEQLIPNLPASSVIVMDNAPYHCAEKTKQPNCVSLKAQMQEWLTSKGVSFTADMSKACLMELIEGTPAKREYIIDSLLEQHGHSVLRLPPYHSDLNPIELVWGHIEGAVVKGCLFNNLDDTQFLEKTFSEYSPEMWQKCCTHVKALEHQYFVNDKVLDREVDKIIIQLANSISLDETSDEDEYAEYEKD